MKQPDWLKDGIDINETTNPITFEATCRARYEPNKVIAPYIIEQAVKQVVHTAMRKIMEDIYKDIDAVKMLAEIKHDLKMKLFFTLVQEAAQEMKDDDSL